MSDTLFRSPAVRSGDALSKATRRPSALTLGSDTASTLAGVPFVVDAINSLAPVPRT